MPMTIKELYEYARATHRENYVLQVQYQDAGGIYDEKADMSGVDFDDEEKKATLS